MHWIIELRDESGKTIDFYRFASRYSAKAALSKVINFYKANKNCKPVYSDIEKTARIDIYFTTYETNDEQKRLTIDKAQITELINAA